MEIKLSDLPQDLQRRAILAAGGRVRAQKPRERVLVQHTVLGRVCGCLSEIYRPDGQYPESCDVCGKRWSEVKQ